MSFIIELNESDDNIFIPCVYEYFGCNDRINKNNMKKHLIEKNNEHLEMISKKMLILNNNFNDRINKLFELKDDLIKKNNIIKETLEKIHNFSKRKRKNKIYNNDDLYIYSKTKRQIKNKNNNNNNNKKKENENFSSEKETNSNSSQYKINKIK